MREQCQEIVNQRMPQLVRLLLGIKGEQQEQEHSTVYKNCLNYSLNTLEQYPKPFSTIESIQNNLADFVERFHVENLKEVGEAVKMLAGIVIDDHQCPERIRWMSLDFMLSVNWLAFRTARINLEELMKFKVKLLESIATITIHAPPENTANTCNEFSCKQSQFLEQDTAEQSCFDNESMHDALDLSQYFPEDSTLEDSTNCSTTDGSSTQSMPLPDRATIKKLNQALNFMRRSIEEFSLLQNEASSESGIKELNSSRIGFARSYGEYLRELLKQENMKLKEQGGYNEERLFVREVLCAFFAPTDSRHFVLTDRLIEMRSIENLSSICRTHVLEHLLLSLQYMQQLHIYIECFETPHCHGDRLDSLTTLTLAMRRLLKPFVESLTFYEQRLKAGKVPACIQGFMHATRGSFQCLRLLWSVAAKSFLQLQQPWQLYLAPHKRCQNILGSLLSLTSEPGEADTEGCRACAAALLLHMLRVYCRYLNNWWQSGDFSDWYDEFPARRTDYKGHTVYTMRNPSKNPDEDQDLHVQSIYLIIQQHIKSCGTPLALLYDSKRLEDFVDTHESLFKESLHHSLVNALMQQLEPYQIETLPKTQTIPNIFLQMKATRNMPLRKLFYMYYKETLPDFKQPSNFAIDELLKQFQLCAPYTPLDELICLTLERQLDQRALLINSYVLHLLRVKLQVDAVLEHLRSIFLLINFELYAKQLEQLLDLLEQRAFTEVAEQLQHIIDSQNPQLGYPFSVQLPNANLEQLRIVFNCDPALSSIITESHLELYNAAFRFVLQLHVAVYRLQQFPDLSCNPDEIRSLLALKSTLSHRLIYLLQTKKLEAAAWECDDELQSAVTLPQMQAAHHQFVAEMEKLLLQECNQFSDLQYLMLLTRFLGGLWRRTEHILSNNFMESSNEEEPEEFKVAYTVATQRYLATLNGKAKELQCFVRSVVKEVKNRSNA